MSKRYNYFIIKMTNIKPIVYLSLLIEIFSTESLNFFEKEKNLFDSEDLEICHKFSNKIQDMSSTTKNPCSSINSSLKKKQNKCCRCTANYDPLKMMKRRFPENWKKEISKLCQLMRIYQNKN